MTENKMKNFELNDEELDQVVGGVVRISGNTNRVGFTTLNKVYNLQNCTAIQARNLCEELMEQYTGETEHELACEAALKERGWI